MLDHKMIEGQETAPISVAVTSAFDRLQVETAPEEAETKLFLESHWTDF